MKKSLLLPLLLVALLLVPAGARASDWVLSSLRISIGETVHTGRSQMRHERERRHCRERHHPRHHREARWERRHHRHHRHYRAGRHQVVERRVIIRPGGRIVIADGRRW